MKIDIWVIGWWKLSTFKSQVSKATTTQISLLVKSFLEKKTDKADFSCTKEFKPWLIVAGAIIRINFLMLAASRLKSLTCLRTQLF